MPNEVKYIAFICQIRKNTAILLSQRIIIIFLSHFDSLLHLALSLFIVLDSARSDDFNDGVTKENGIF